jgi:septum formation protein
LNYVLETASAKAHDVYRAEINNRERGEPAIVIAADTIVVSHAGRILEKPKSEADHIATLKMLRDEGEHKVMTAVAVMKPLESAVDPGYAMETHVEETTVKFDPTGISPHPRTTGLSTNMHSYRRTYSRIRQNARRQR